MKLRIKEAEELEKRVRALSCSSAGHAVACMLSRACCHVQLQRAERLML